MVRGIKPRIQIRTKKYHGSTILVATYAIASHQLFSFATFDFFNINISRCCGDCGGVRNPRRLGQTEESLLERGGRKQAHNCLSVSLFYVLQSQGHGFGSGSAWIRINLSCWIRIRNLNADQEGKHDTKIEKSTEFSCF